MALHVMILGVALGRRVIANFFEVFLYKRHAKWVVYLHIRMDAVYVHKKKLILKMGYYMKGCDVIKESEVA